MTYSAIVGFSHALAYYRESQERALKAAQLETQLVEARLKTLQAELHPHFLFNTLHAISTLVHTNPDLGRPDDQPPQRSAAPHVRSHPGEPQCPLQEELEFLQKYLEIEQTRFQDRLTVRYDIDPDTLDAEVPRLILQPLVENAIKHGVAPRSGPGLRADRRRDGEDGTLWLEVRDNGVGLSAGARARASTAASACRTRATGSSACTATRHRLEFSDRRGRASRSRSRSRSSRVAVAAADAGARPAWHDRRRERADDPRPDRRRRAAGARAAAHAARRPRTGLEVVAECQRRHRQPSTAIQQLAARPGVPRRPDARRRRLRRDRRDRRRRRCRSSSSSPPTTSTRCRRSTSTRSTTCSSRSTASASSRRSRARASSSSAARTAISSAGCSRWSATSKPAPPRLERFVDQVRRPRVLRPRRRDRLDRGGGQLRQAARRRRRAPVPRDDERASRRSSIPDTFFRIHRSPHRQHRAGARSCSPGSTASTSCSCGTARG